jgi:hypothetical protein
MFSISPPVFSDGNVSEPIRESEKATADSMRTMTLDVEEICKPFCSCF